MKNKFLVFCSALLVAPIYAKSFIDKSPLSTTDMAVCTAAVMKSGQGITIYTQWSDALNARYKIIFPNMSDKERSDYTAGRVIDKRKSLNRDGINSTPNFLKFYNNNCKDFAP